MHSQTILPRSNHRTHYVESPIAVMVVVMIDQHADIALRTPDHRDAPSGSVGLIAGQSSTAPFALGNPAILRSTSARRQPYFA